MAEIKRVVENAHKFLYLIRTYPEKNIQQVIQLFQLPPVETNDALWWLQDKGWLEIETRKQEIDDLDPKTGAGIGKKTIDAPFGKVIDQPKHYEFGENVAELEQMLVYAFEHINAEEKDMEENFLSNWMAGYFPQDILISVKHLLDTNVLHEYELEDGENAYIFYTLKRNAGKNWGAKQFKVNPLTGEEQADADKPSQPENSVAAEQ